MAETQSQSDYRYTPSSAQSTRQILESTSSTSTSSNDVPFHPPKLTRTKSSNYAEADARARATVADSVQSGSWKENTPGGGSTEQEPSSGAGGVGWKPKMGRKQSWNQQDLKRAMQMSVMEDVEADKEAGFTEAGMEKKP